MFFIFIFSNYSNCLVQFKKNVFPIDSSWFFPLLCVHIVVAKRVPRPHTRHRRNCVHGQDISLLFLRFGVDDASNSFARFLREISFFAGMGLLKNTVSLLKRFEKSLASNNHFLLYLLCVHGQKNTLILSTVALFFSCPPQVCSGKSPS